MTQLAVPRAQSGTADGGGPGRHGLPQPDTAAAHAQSAKVAQSLAKRFPKAAQVLADAKEDIPYMAIPNQHWRRLHSTNPLKRMLRESGRRMGVVGIFPNRTSLIRLSRALLMKQQDEWMAAPRWYFSQASMKKLYPS